MSDLDSVWTGGVVPELPDITGLHSTGDKIIPIFDKPIINNNLTDKNESIELERLKLIVIKGTMSKPNLTFSELKRLGCSSEGLVHGSSLTYNHDYFITIIEMRSIDKRIIIYFYR